MPDPCPHCGAKPSPNGTCLVCMLSAGLDPTATSATPTPVSQSPRPEALEEDSFGPYAILKVLGQGGMGDVWSAVVEDKDGTTRRAVIKTIREALIGNEIRRVYGILDDAVGAGVPLTLGVRPEHLYFATTGWPVRVETLELLGAERLVHVRLQDEWLTLRIPAEQEAPAIGEWCHVEAMDQHIHWFDAETGLRIAS